MALFLGGMISGCAALKENLDYNRAVENFTRRNYDLSEGYLQSALRENPKDERAISLLGWIRFKAGRMGEAEELFAEAEKLAPEKPGTMEGLGWIYYGQGLDGRAEEKFRKLGRYAQKHLQSAYWRDYPSADQKFIQSIDSNANYGLGLIAKRKGNWKDAGLYLGRAANQPNQFIDPEIIAAELANTLFESGGFNPAAVQYKKLLLRNPPNPAFLNRYAWCLYQTGDFGGAQKSFQAAQKINSPVAKYYLTVSPGQGVTGKLHAKRIAEAYYGLALLYAREKQFEAAREQLAIALKISPFFHHADEIAALLQEHPEWPDPLK